MRFQKPEADYRPGKQYNSRLQMKIELTQNAFLSGCMLEITKGMGKWESNGKNILAVIQC